MNIQTHRTLAGDNEFHECEFCSGIAHYWSQNELPNGNAGGGVVWHCQAHRFEGRAEAMSRELPKRTKINKTTAWVFYQ